MRPTLPPGLRVFAIGDVHGRADLLRATFARIDERVGASPERRNIEVLLGDYVDRGPDSRGVLEQVIERGARREVRALAGNHELMMLAALADPAQLAPWLRNGGTPTLLSYGIGVDGGLSQEASARTIGSARERIPAAHLAFLGGLRSSFSSGDYFFAHAGVRPGRPLPQQDPQDLAWIREPFLTFTGSFGAVVVHGHTPVERPDVRPNRINIDTGAYATGRLTCLVLEDDRLDFL